MKLTSLNSLKTIKLSEQEKGILWMRIEASKNEVYKKEEKHLPKWVAGIMVTMLPISFAALTLMVSGQALPGQQLYSIKTGVNEPLQRLTIFNSEEKLEFENSLLNKRLKEAKKLKSMGLLDIETAEGIEETIAKQANRVLESEDNAETAPASSDELASSIDRAIDSEVKNNVALAKFKGNAVGSIDAVRIMSGKEIEIDTLTGKSTSAEKVASSQKNVDPAKASVAATASTKPSSMADKSSEITKTALQAEAKVVSTKAEVAKDIVKDKISQNKVAETDSALLQPHKGVDSLEAFTDKSLASVKKIVAKDIDEVEEQELLEAVSEAQATLILTEALAEDSN